jgi:hypothetical protein
MPYQAVVFVSGCPFHLGTSLKVAFQAAYGSHGRTTVYGM